MRKYLSLAVVALSSGGALIAAAGAASAATATDNWRAAPWLGSSPLAMHAAPFSHHDADDHDGICGKQKADYRVGQIDIKLAQMGCIGDLPSMPSVPGPPPVMGPPPMGSPEPCPVVCKPMHPKPPTPPTPPGPPPMPCPPPVVKPPCPPPVPTPPPVPCPPPTPNPCPPGEDHGWSGAEHHEAAPDAGNAMAGLPILGSAVGGLL